MDIRLNNGNQNFKLRVCGVIKYKNKYLIIKHQQNDFFCFIGGHAEIGENTLETVKREIQEESGIKIKKAKLFCIHQNIFNNKNFHELGFYYICIPSAPLQIFDEKQVIENDKGETKTHTLKWATKKELKKINIRPCEIKNLLIKNKTHKLRAI